MILINILILSNQLTSFLISFYDLHCADRTDDELERTLPSVIEQRETSSSPDRSNISAITDHLNSSSSDEKEQIRQPERLIPPG